MGTFRGNQHEKPDRYDFEYQYQDLLTDIRDFAEEHGRAPTTEDVASDPDFPCLERVYGLLGSWSMALEDAGVEPGPNQRGRYGDDERAAMVADLRRVNDRTAGPTLTSRTYDDYGDYATSTVKKYFGSWGDACEAAGLSSGSRHGDRCHGPGGADLDSRHEQAVATYLAEQGLEYVVHPEIDGTNWEADFYLPGAELWIEVDGYRDEQRPNRKSFREKLSFYRREGMEYVVVTGPEDIAETLDEHGASE